ncbi:MAG: flagellar biosynthesis/type III secretory pathway M-ring protein FliF/YscJ [Phenylobacterium sp.]|jgi:flagellar biosynthesis/type III secretory pathway M-ring protein FliF/YscJ
MKSIGHDRNKVDFVLLVKLFLVLVISIGISFRLVLWAEEPQMRPLMSDLRVADSVKVVDVLDQYAIRYHIDLSHHMLYVEAQKNDAARIALARVGIIIEYPDYLGKVDTPKADKQGKAFKPFYEEPWFIKLYRLGMASLVIIVLFVAVVRPMFRLLIFGEGFGIEEQVEDEKKDKKSGLL